MTAPQTPIEAIKPWLLGLVGREDIMMGEIDETAAQILSAIYNLLESKAVDVQQSKRTSSGNDYRTSFKAVPLDKVRELLK